MKYGWLGWWVWTAAVVACSTPASTRISSQAAGGPWGSYPTCSTTSNLVAPHGPVPSQVVTYMDNAAKNWGCSYQVWSNQASSTDSDGLGAYKWYPLLVDEEVFPLGISSSQARPTSIRTMTITSSS